MTTRIVKVWQIAAKTPITVETAATTFGQLRNQLTANFSSELLDYENSRFIEGNSRLTFDNDLATLPETVKTKDGASTTELNILILPKKKTKSGAQRSRREVYTHIQALKLKYPEASKYFRGYVNVATAILERQIKQFEKKFGSRGEQPQQPKPIEIMPISDTSNSQPITLIDLSKSPDALLKADISHGIDLILKGVKQILSTGLLKSSKESNFSFEDVNKLFTDLTE